MLSLTAVNSAICRMKYSEFHLICLSGHSTVPSCKHGKLPAMHVLTAFTGTLQQGACKLPMRLTRKIFIGTLGVMLVMNEDLRRPSPCCAACCQHLQHLYSHPMILALQVCQLSNGTCLDDAQRRPTCLQRATECHATGKADTTAQAYCEAQRSTQHTERKQLSGITCTQCHKTCLLHGI